MKKKVWTIIIIAVLALVGVSAYLLTSKVTPCDTNGSNCGSVVSKVSDWKTYKDEKYPFQFNYPSDWIIHADSGIENTYPYSEVIALVAPENNDNYSVGKETSYYAADVIIKVCRKISDDCSAGDIKLDATNSVVSIQPGLNGKGIVAIGRETNYEVRVDFEGKTYLIEFPSAEDGSKLSAEQKQILSTFKFVPVTSSVSKARMFLENLAKDFHLTAPITQTSKDINFANNIEKKLNGYSLTTSSDSNNYYQYYLSKSFKEDWYNSGDATFNGASGYKTSDLICVNQYRTIAPDNDVSHCDPGKDSDPCSYTTEIYCADLNQ